MRTGAIGGFFELEIPTTDGSFLYPQGRRFQSARAAFLALLRTGRPRRVRLPYYICSTMLASMRQADVEVVYYTIDRKLRIAEDVVLDDGDWLLYVDYFGICGSNAASVLSRFDPRHVVIDCSQALFAPPRGCLASIYSPRKFLGVPDGGILISSLPVPEASEVDTGSFDRAIPLLKRAACSPEAAYAEHHCAELTLFDQEPKRMSEFTGRILSGVDYDRVRRARSRNFTYLHSHLGKYNTLPIDLLEVNGPLCYPLLTSNPELRGFLIDRRIYVPTYWHDVLAQAPPWSFETHLVRQLVPLPCDQRYGERDLERVVKACHEFFARKEGKQVMELDVTGDVNTKR